MTIKQLQRQINTWRRQMPEIGQEIVLMAEEKGILLQDYTQNKKNIKAGKLTRVSPYKKDAARVKEFMESYQTKYGSFSAFAEKQKARIKAYEETTGIPIKGKGWKSKYNALEEFRRLTSELFDIFEPSTAYEEYQYVQTIPLDVAIARLKREIENHQIEDVIDYAEVYGDDYEPPYE